MHLTLNEYDAWNYTQRDANGVPTIQLNHSIRIRVGGGLTSYRELLQIFVDGKEVSEVGSAGLPQQYSYLHWVQKPTKNHQYVIEFRYRDASFFAKVGMTEGTVKSPALNQRVHNKEVIRLAWDAQNATSSIAVGTRFFSGQSSGGCALVYKPKAQTKTNNLFVLIWNESGKKPPCIGEAKVSWLNKEKMVSPFTEFSVTKITSRIQPFHIH